MTSDDILKITILCETKNGSYFAGVTDDKAFISHAANVMKLVEIDKQFVGNIDAERIMKKDTDGTNTKQAKLF